MSTPENIPYNLLLLHRQWNFKIFKQKEDTKILKIYENYPLTKKINFEYNRLKKIIAR